MDLFKFIPVSSPTTLERGESINRVESVMWVERYAEPGEFEISSKLSSGLKDFLPIGTLISHVDTLEVMIVENHEIVEETDKDSKITISGRSFDTILENRVVGLNYARQFSDVWEYFLGANYTWEQAVYMINDHVLNTNANDKLVNIAAQSSVTGTGVSVDRVIKRGNLSQRVRELLSIDELGIRTIRRNPFGVRGSSTQTILQIFRGVNRPNVIFSWKAGEIESAEYLFSNKKLKNSALVEGRFLNTVVDLGPVAYDRRVTMVDASDIDGYLSAPPPAGAERDELLAKMVVRGQQVLKSQKNVTINRTDISQVTKFQYRKDYEVGDLVTLDGNFSQMALMRVDEYVEIEDENGESGHPTLSIPGA